MFFARNEWTSPNINKFTQKPYLTLRMDITNRCNLRCIMCHFADESRSKSPYNPLTLNDFQKLLSPIAPIVHTLMLSCGSEPLLSKHLPDILKYLAKAHPQIEIELCTNAMLLNDSLRSLFIETGVTTLMASIDATSRKLFENIRCGAQYDRVIGNVLALRDLKSQSGARYPELIFNFVMMNRNIHEAPFFIHMAEKMGGKIIDFHHATPELESFPFDEMLDRVPEKYNYYRGLIAKEGARRRMIVFLPAPFKSGNRWDARNDPEPTIGDFLSVMPDPLTLPVPKPKSFAESYTARNFSSTLVEELEGRVLCKRPFTEIMIRDQEEILPCPWYKKTLALLSSGESLSDIFTGRKFNRLREKMLKGEIDIGCSGCPVIDNFLPTRPG